MILLINFIMWFIVASLISKVFVSLISNEWILSMVFGLIISLWIMEARYDGRRSTR